MKQRLIRWLVGGWFLLLAIAPMPCAAKQSRPEQEASAFSRLELSDQQATQITQILANARDQIKALLKPEQF
jgi:hypothetical protein